MKNNIAEITSLYIHIPFCISKCKYCDFFSIPRNEDYSVPDLYVLALCREIKYRIQKFNTENLKTVYVGGGTPSLLTEVQLLTILDTVKKSAHNSNFTEVTIELNPDDINKNLLKMLDSSGVTRISVGIQSMNDNVLKFCGRRAGRIENIKALECIEENWKKDFSIDMISALPYETEESFKMGLEEVIKYNPDHISLYSLTIEEETPFGKMYNSKDFIYDWDFADNMWLTGREILEKKGYEQYEVSNFCKKEKECLHNLSYWEHKNYLGCGSGACGTVYPVRWNNSKNIDEYIKYWCDDVNIDKNIGLPQELETIDLDVEKFEFFMMGLRKLNGISDADFIFYFGEKMPRNVIEKFKEWNKRKLTVIQKNNNETRYMLSRDGILFLNTFLTDI